MRTFLECLHRKSYDFLLSSFLILEKDLGRSREARKFSDTLRMTWLSFMADYSQGEFSNDFSLNEKDSVNESDDFFVDLFDGYGSDEYYEFEGLVNRVCYALSQYLFYGDHYSDALQFYADTSISFMCSEFKHYKLFLYAIIDGCMGTRGHAYLVDELISLGINAHEEILSLRNLFAPLTAAICFDGTYVKGPNLKKLDKLDYFEIRSIEPGFHETSDPKENVERIVFFIFLAKIFGEDVLAKSMDDYYLEAKSAALASLVPNKELSDLISLASDNYPASTACFELNLFRLVLFAFKDLLARCSKNKKLDIGKALERLGEYNYINYSNVCDLIFFVKLALYIGNDVYGFTGFNNEDPRTLDEHSKLNGCLEFDAFSALIGFEQNIDPKKVLKKAKKFLPKDDFSLLKISMDAEGLLDKEKDFHKIQAKLTKLASKFSLKSLILTKDLSLLSDAEKKKLKPVFSPKGLLVNKDTELPSELMRIYSNALYDVEFFKKLDGLMFLDNIFNVLSKASNKDELKELVKRYVVALKSYSNEAYFHQDLFRFHSPLSIRPILWLASKKCTEVKQDIRPTYK